MFSAPRKPNQLDEEESPLPESRTSSAQKRVLPPISPAQKDAPTNINTETEIIPVGGSSDSSLSLHMLADTTVASSGSIAASHSKLHSSYNLGSVTPNYDARPPLSAHVPIAATVMPVPVESYPSDSSEDEDEESESSPELICENIKKQINKMNLQDADLTSKDFLQDYKYIYKHNSHGKSVVDRKLYADCVYDNGFLDVFLKFLNILKDEKYLDTDQGLGENMAIKMFKKALIIVWNTSDSSVKMCQGICDSPILKILLEFLSMPCLENDKLKTGKSKLYIVKGFLGICVNVASRIDAREHMRDLNAVEIILHYFKSKFLMVKTKAVLILAYILNEDENDKIHASDQNIRFIVGILEAALKERNHKSKKHGFAAFEVVQGLNKIAANDLNKEAIVRAGALPFYVKMLQENSSVVEQKLAAQGIWILAFSKINKDIIVNIPGCIESLETLTESSDEEVQSAANGALWVIKNKGEEIHKKNAKVFESTVKHIMISYQWDSKSTMLWVKDKLKAAGYKVWMDIDNIQGSILEAMAKAVEEAAVVVICMSQKYKDSPNCRTEAEYTYNLRKDIIPLNLEPAYKADGWLGAMVGMKLYFDFSNERSVDSAFQGLIGELGDRGKFLDNVDSALNASLNGSLLLPMNKDSAENWSKEKIQEWLEENNLGQLKQRFAGFDGQILLGLQEMQRQSPDFYYSTLKHDMNLELVTLIQFTTALKKIS